MRVISTSEIQAAKELLTKFSSNMNAYFEDFEMYINGIKQSEVIKSFYASGPLGEKKEQDMMMFEKSLKNLIEAVYNGPGSLFDATNQYLDSQEALLRGQTAPVSHAPKGPDPRLGDDNIAPNTPRYNNATLNPSTTIGGVTNQSTVPNFRDMTKIGMEVK